MAEKILKTIAAGYGLLLALAAGGLFFANFVGLIVGAVTFGAEKAPDPRTLAWWIHGGWILGVGVALVGTVMNRIHRRSSPRGESRARSGKSRSRSFRKPPRGRRHGFVASTLLGGCGGALLGLLLGGSLLLIWFSLTYSPFAPQEWVASVEVERRRVDRPYHQSGLSTDHPIAMYAFGAPIALGAAAGAVLGGVCGVYEHK